jgi:hypothetical protein
VFNTYRDSLTWQNDLTLDERNSLILGGDWYEDRINSSTDFNEDSRWNRAAFIQHRYQATASPPSWAASRRQSAVRRPEQLERHLHPAAEPGQRPAAELQRRLPRADLQRPVLPGLQQPGPETRNLERATSCNGAVS